MPLTGEVFKRENVKVHKFLNSLTQVTEAWKWVEKSKGVRDDMRALMEYYDGSTNGECHMNITRVDLKELHFKRQDDSHLKSM